MDAKDRTTSLLSEMNARLVVMERCVSELIELKKKEPFLIQAAKPIVVDEGRSSDSSSTLLVMKIVDKARAYMERCGLRELDGFNEKAFQVLFRTILDQMPGVVYKMEYTCVGEDGKLGFADIYIQSPHRIVIELKYTALGFIKGTGAKYSDRTWADKETYLDLQMRYLEDKRCALVGVSVQPETGQLCTVDKVIKNAKAQAKGYARAIRFSENLKKTDEAFVIYGIGHLVHWEKA